MEPRTPSSAGCVGVENNLGSPRVGVRSGSIRHAKQPRERPLSVPRGLHPTGAPPPEASRSVAILALVYVSTHEILFSATQPPIPRVQSCYCTTNFCVLKDFPLRVLTATFPLVNPLGTVAWIMLGLNTV